LIFIDVVRDHTGGGDLSGLPPPGPQWVSNALPLSNVNRPSAASGSNELA
jgi:hypothetical protein